MAVHAEPRPLEAPLSGGVPGSSVTVEPMVAGTFRSPPVLHASPSGEVGSLKILRQVSAENPPSPIPAFLIRHPGIGPVLVDTGLHPSVASDPEENLGRFNTWMFKPVLEPGRDVPARLRAAGIDPGEVRVVILTHLHLDHASAIADFPEATFVVTAAEWKAATTGSMPFRQGYRRQQYDYAFDFRSVSYDGPMVSSYATFGRTIDLLGDGSIRLVSTPGHSAGHQSVLARLKDRDLVIAGDAIYSLDQLEPRADLPGRIQDAHNYRRSLQELRLFHTQFPDAVITPGHDAAFFESAPAVWE